MAQTWMLSASVLLLLIYVQRISGQLAIVGESVNLTMTENCSDGKLTTRDNSRTVATLVKGVFAPTEEYKDRIEQLSLTLTLNRVNYNDAGLYEFLCGERVVTAIQLRALVPTEVSVAEGEPATLPCHSFTAGESAGLVTWVKNGELVAELDPSTRTVRYGAGYEGRVKESSDWAWTGSVSITFESVHLEDAGVFICHARGGDGKTAPVAVRLKVANKTKPDQTTCSPSPASQDQGTTGEKMGTWIVVSIAVTFVITLLALLLGWFLKSRRSKVSSRPPTDVETGLSLLSSSDDQVNGGPPVVQESVCG